jgi:hypothetical protein
MGLGVNYPSDAMASANERTVMSKSKVIFTLGAFLLAFTMGSTALADKDKNKKGKCPNGWDRVKVHKAMCEDEARKIDKWGNHDDLVCEKHKPGVIKYQDNDYK